MLCSTHSASPRHNLSTHLMQFPMGFINMPIGQQMSVALFTQAVILPPKSAHIVVIFHGVRHMVSVMPVRPIFNTHPPLHVLMLRD